MHLSAKGFAPETIGRAMREASPDLHDRKRGHIDDDVRRTVRAAVRVHQLSRERDRSRGRERARALIVQLCGRHALFRG